MGQPWVSEAEPQCSVHGAVLPVVVSASGETGLVALQVTASSPPGPASLCCLGTGAIPIPRLSGAWGAGIAWQGGACLPPSRRHPRNQRKPRPALSWCPANEPEPWLSPALAAPGAVGCFSSFPCASGPERKSPGRAGGGWKVAAAAVPRWHRHRDVTRGCAGLCRKALISSRSLWKGLGLFSPCSPQRCGAFSFPAHAPRRDRSL